jgi:hypothetical protein
MKRENLRISKSVEVKLTADEVKNAILLKAGARNSSENSVEISSDGTATVVYTITREKA